MKFQSRQDKFDCSIDGSLLRREKGGFFIFRIQSFNLIVSSFYLKFEKLLLLILKTVLKNGRKSLEEFIL